MNRHLLAANDLHDREEKRAANIDAAAPVELLGCRWYTVDGESTPAHAEWTADWYELLADVCDEPWALQSIVYRTLGRMRAHPSDGEPVEPELASALHSWFHEVIQLRAEASA